MAEPRRRADARADTPPHRYTAALAERDRDRAGRTAGSARARSTRPTRSATSAEGFDQVADRPKLYVLDMFPYPSGAGLHVGHPLGYIGTDVYARYQRMTGHNVLHTMGYDAFGLPAEQYAVQTGQHPRVTTEANIATMRRQLRRLGLGHDPRRSIATTDVGYYRWTQWIFLQIFNSWYDTDADRARPIAELVAELDAGTREPAEGTNPSGRPWAELSADRAPRGRRRPPPGLPRRGAGQLVPRPGHGAGQRGGHRRRPQRARQLPRVPAAAEAVDDAHHRLRRPAARRPRRCSTGPRRSSCMQRNWIGRSEGAARHVPASTGRRPGHRGVHHPARHAVRRHLHGAGARAPAGRRADRRRRGRDRRRRAVVDRRRTPRPAEAVAAYRRQAGAPLRRSSARPRPGTRPASSPARYATNPATGDDDPGLHRRLRADGLRHRGDHGRARPGRARLGRSPRPSTCRSSAPSSRPTASTGKAYVGEGPAINSANAEVASTAWASPRPSARIIDWLEAHGRRRRARSPTSCATGCSAASATGASRSRSSTTTTACRAPCPSRAAGACCPRSTTTRPPRSPTTTRPRCPSRRWPGRPTGSTVELDLGDGPKTYRREMNTMPQWAGSCWYELRYLDPTNDERVRRPRDRALLDGPAVRRRLRRRRPVRRRRRARRAAPAVRPLLAQGAVRPRPRVARPSRSGGCSTRASSRPPRTPTTAGFYVDAAAVVERDGGFCHGDERGHPRVREDGQEPAELGHARRDVRAATAPTRCGCTRCSPARSTRAARGTPRPSSACTGCCSGSGATWSTRRPASSRVVDDAARRRRRCGRCTAPSPPCATTWRSCGSTRRSPSITELNNHLTAPLPRRRRAPRGGRAAGAAAGAAGPAHRRGAVVPPGPRRLAGLRAVPRGRPGAAGRRHGRDPGAGQRQGPGRVTRPGRRRRRRASRPPPGPTTGWPALLEGATSAQVIVVPGRMVNFVVG